jgi:thiol-disulfide isomerase/thioredoxin
MPLVDVESPDREASGVQYLLFFASGAPSWCPDCREALPTIEAVFQSVETPLQVIKVGLRDEWKSAGNKWRGKPFHVKETPCIIKLINVSGARAALDAVRRGQDG